MKSSLALACLALAACSGERAAEPAARAKESPVVDETPTAPAVAPVEHHGVAWYEDAPDAARARALAENKPLVVDLWAPWCHTCLSMQNFVLTRENLGALGDQFVFLALNTERAENAKLLEKLAVEAWPTFFVAEPKDWSVRGRWVGAASPSEFGDFLRDGRRAFDAARAGKLDDHDPFGLMLRGDALSAEQKFEEAAHLFEEAVKLGGDTFTRRGDALVSQISALRRAKQTEACVALGIAHMDHTGTSVSASDFASYALSCAEELPEKDARRKQVAKAIDARLTPACEQGTFTLSPDDRSDACATLSGARGLYGDTSGEKAAMEKRLAVIEEAAKGLPDDVAMTYDWARADALTELGRAAEAIPLLEAREKAVPHSYNPPHYLARVHKSLGQWDLGLSAIERALGKAYGPRKAGMLGLKADLLLGAGKKDEARAVVQAQLAAYDALPAGQKQPRARDGVAARLNGWQ